MPQSNSLDRELPKYFAVKKKSKCFLPFFLAWSTSPTRQLFAGWFFFLTFRWFIDPNATFSANSEVAIDAFETTIEQKGKSFTTSCTDSLAERFLFGQQRFELPVILSRSQVGFNLPEMQKYMMINYFLVKVWSLWTKKFPSHNDLTNFPPFFTRQKSCQNMTRWLKEFCLANSASILSRSCLKCKNSR